MGYHVELRKIDDDDVLDRDAWVKFVDADPNMAWGDGDKETAYLDDQVFSGDSHEFSWGPKRIHIYKASDRATDKLIEMANIFGFCLVRHELDAADGLPYESGAPISKSDKPDAEMLKPYRLSNKYEVDDRISHPKFGEGKVVFVKGKTMQVKFDIGIKVLAHST
ncbi:hypothetical protein JYT83_01320 [bacterium AH-315-F18]|nr:hypothetical protein [bacterium AH-315-F18]